MDGIKHLGVVALLADKPEAGLKRGDVGTIVEVFDNNEQHPAGCIVEFVDETGKVLALLEVTNVSEIVPLNFERLLDSTEALSPLNEKTLVPNLTCGRFTTQQRQHLTGDVA